MSASRVRDLRRVGVDFGSISCYPYGSYDAAVVAMAAEAGYASAATCDRAAAYPGDSLPGYAWKLHMKNRRRDTGID